jgi:outer membrane biogenesis lipoprotein LolB
MRSRLESVLVIAVLLLPACTLAPPLPQEDWEVPSDPLYPPTV